MTKNNNQPRDPIINDIPFNDLDKVMANGVEFGSFQIQRRGLNGKITLGSRVVRRLQELKSGEFQDWLLEFAGGGEYEITARDQTGNFEKLLPTFRLNLPGQPREPRRNPQGMDPSQMAGFATPQMFSGQAPGFHGMPMMVAPGQMAFPPQEALPPWQRAYDAATQWRFYYDAMQARGLPNGASVPSDQMAMGFNQTLQSQLSAERAENAKLREKAESAAEANRQQMDSLLREIANIKSEVVRKESEGQMAALRAELMSLRDLRSQPAPKEPTIEWAPILAAVAPMVTGYLTSQRDYQIQQMRTSQDSTNLILSTVAKPKDTVAWDKVLAAVAPFAIQWFQSYGPQAQASARAELDESRIMLMKMALDAVHASAGDNPPWWFPMLDQFLQTIGGAVDGAMKMKALAPNAGPQARGGALPAPVHATTGPAMAQAPAANEDAMWANFQAHDAQAAAHTKLVMDALPPELGFSTHEWKVLLFNVHCRHVPTEMAHEIVTHLQQCQKFMLLPGPLANVFQNPASISSLIEQLPIWTTDNAYAVALRDALVQELHQTASSHGNGALDVDGDDDLEDEEEETEDAHA